MSPEKRVVTTDTSQSLIEHLLELRNRLLRALVAALIVFIVLVPFANEVYEYLSQPLRAIIPNSSSMIATNLISPFFTPLKLTIYAALFITMPYSLYQLWAFVAPGLYKQEKRVSAPLLLSSIILFYAGILFSYYIVFPLIFAFLTTVGPVSVAVMPDINSFLDFSIKLFFAFGLAFEIPVAIVILTRSGFVSVESLASKRPYIIIGFFVIGMLMTPPDIFSQTLLAIPMWLLFEIGLFCSKISLQTQH